MSALLHEYRAAKHAQDVRAEKATGGYATELARYFGTDGEGDAVETRVTWKQWLIDHKSEPMPEQVNVLESVPAFNDTSMTADEFFRMGRDELRDWAQLGSLQAKAELDRRAAKRAAKRERVAA